MTSDSEMKLFTWGDSLFTDYYPMPSMSQMHTCDECLKSSIDAHLHQWQREVICFDILGTIYSTEW